MRPPHPQATDNNTAGNDANAKPAQATETAAVAVKAETAPAVATERMDTTCCRGQTWPIV